MKKLILFLLLVCNTAFAQKAVIFEDNSGNRIGYFTTDNGKVTHIVYDIQILKVPSPTPNPTQIALQMIVLRDQTQAETKKQAVLLDLQAKYQKNNPPEVFILDRIDTSATTQSWLKLKPQEAKFPYYFLVGKDRSILAKGEIPTVTQEIETVIKKYQEKSNATK